MAGGAVTQAIDDILAAFPRGRRRRINLWRGFGLIKPVPEDQPGADVERKYKLVGCGSLAHWLQTVQERKQVIRVAACQAAKIDIGKSGIEMMPVRGDAFVHGAIKLVSCPSADAGFSVRCDVGGIDGTELGAEWQPSGIGGAMSLGMAARTVAQNCEIAAAGDRSLGPRSV